VTFATATELAVLRSLDSRFTDVECAVREMVCCAV
jgi:hypothetical protein